MKKIFLFGSISLIILLLIFSAYLFNSRSVGKAVGSFTCGTTANQLLCCKGNYNTAAKCNNDPGCIWDTSLNMCISRLAKNTTNQTNQTQTNQTQTNQTQTNQTQTNQTQTNQTGNLYVVSNPKAANLYVDNVIKGKTPKTLTGLSVGNHAVKLTKLGYNNYTTTKYIYAGQTVSLNVTLTKTNQTNSTS